MKKIYGFTLIELMVTIFIAAILVSFAIPSFQQSIRNNKTTTQANELITALNLARAEAIKQSVTVTVCSSTDQATCSGNTNWVTGWIVFTDQDGDRAIDDDGDADLCETGDDDDCLIRVWEALSGGALLTGSANFVAFNADGRANAQTTLTLKASASCGTDEQRTITVTSTGRSSAVKEDC